MYELFPRCCGIGVRAQHYCELLARRPALGWIEAHSENFFARGGVQRDVLNELRSHYLLSLHGVGLSIGSTDAFDRRHLGALARLVRDCDPTLVSEHLSWGSVDGRFMNDLLPLPYTEEVLRHTATRVRTVQEVLGRQILIENVSSYLQFTASEMPEWQFLAALAAESGCAILLDLNNLYINAMNHGFDPYEYLDFIPPLAVREIHLAGHAVQRIGTREVLLDTHATAVCAAVWKLYDRALERFGPVPTLIEWDADVPALDVLVAEAHKIEQLLQVRSALAA
jgi:uncharacterized protein (UPF0276 family)